MISVCVPVNNREKTIESCLDSIRFQSVSPKQVIITDYGSSDNSRLVIQNYLEKYELIDLWFFYCKDEKPVGAEDWNFPLKFVENDYVAILEGDDMWPEDYIKKIVKVIQSIPDIKLIFSGIYNSNKNKDFDFKVVKSSEAVIQFSKLKWLIAPSQTVFRFERDNIGFFKTDKYFYAPEMQYWTELAMEDGNVVFLSENQVFRRISDESKFSELYFNDHFNFVAWLRQAGIINELEFYIIKLDLFYRNFIRFIIRIVFNKKTDKGTLKSLIKNLLR